MITAWRICKARHSATAFDGYGAKLNGGRWNSPGMAVVYTSAVASQAFLEMLVHADATIASLSYELIPVEFEERLVKMLDPAGLPSNWREDQTASRRIGDAWVQASQSVVMSVPSALLQIDQNFIVNPAHPHMNQLIIGKPQPLIIDDRIKTLFAGK